MSKKTEQAIENWETSDTDMLDDICIHFDEVNVWDWCDVADEGLRIWNIAFPEWSAEPNSPVDAILTGVAATAAKGAYSFVAACLGVNARSLELVVAHWSEYQLSPEELMHLCKEHDKWLENHDYEIKEYKV